MRAENKAVQALMDFYLSHNGYDYSNMWKLGRTQGLKTERYTRLNDGCCDIYVES